MRFVLYLIAVFFCVCGAASLTMLVLRIDYGMVPPHSDSPWQEIAILIVSWILAAMYFYLASVSRRTTNLTK